MQTKINLLSSGTIDMYDDIAVSCTYSIADIKDPDKRNTSFSKTITIPGTKNNNKLFGQLFEIGIDGSFNPNLKTSCNLTVDNVIIMRGNLQLLTVKKIDNDKIEYDCTIIGVTGNIFAELSDNKLEDLDLSEYDHALTTINQSNSWASSIIKNGSAYAFTLGEGYVYPLIDYGDDSQHAKWDVTQLITAIYAKTYFDKIFKYAGFTYNSTFLNSTFFKSLIIPGILPTLTDTQIVNKEFQAQLINNFNYAVPCSPTQMQFTNTSSPNYDPGNVFYEAGYTYYSPSNNKVELNINLTGSYFFDDTNIFTLNPPFVKFTGNVNFHVLILKTSNGVTTVISNSSIPILPQNTNVYPGNTTPNYNYFVKTTTPLLTGDFIQVQIYVDPKQYKLYDATNTEGYDALAVPVFTIKTASYFSNRMVNNVISQGDTIVMNNTIPTDILMKDYLMSIIRMFNLYVEPDADIANQLNIEPRNTFYSTASPLDWTAKLSLDKQLEIKPMGALDAKTYKFTYKQDDDYYNAQYSGKYSQIYGERIWDVQNEFLKNEKKIEVIFAPTPCVNFNNSDRITPAIYARDNNGVITKKTGKLRILYYGGLVPCYIAWKHADGNTYFNYFFYPYAGMLDHPTNPTLDLGFGAVKEVYFTLTKWPTANLFNTYYKTFIEEISDKDSKIVVAYLYLTIADINQLDFGRLIHIDGINYRLNKIIDFNPVLNQLTKVELLKAKNQTAFTPKTGTVRGGIKTALPE
tara:strand:+ start:775 stop:3006 length:2232 start_codon:yes stop_codon:yes gene_type:complete